jgi:hypothetical protein
MYQLEKTGSFMLDWQKCHLNERCDSDLTQSASLSPRKPRVWRPLQSWFCTTIFLVFFIPVVEPLAHSLLRDAHAAEPAPPSLMVSDPRLERDLAGNWVLKGGVSVSLSPALIVAIERGVALEFESIFRARKTRWVVFKSLVYQEKRVARLQFQPLTRLFYVNKEGSPTEAFDDLTKALRACLVVRDWEVAPSQQVFDGLELSLRLRLDENALPKPLLIGALTTADYQLTTGWLAVNYQEEVTAQ